MGSGPAQGLLFLLVLGASSLILAQNFYCHKGEFMSLEKDPNAFNWTTEKVETCDNGALCHESVLIVKAGTRTAVLASKGCIADVTEATTFVQHAPPPGIMVISSSRYCQSSQCNGRASLPEIWTQNIPAATWSETLHCPTCVAFGTCPNAPYLPCPNDTNRCYHGRFQVTGEDIDSTLEIKGCTSITGCRLMSGVFTIGPMIVTEICPYQSLTELRSVENGASWLPISVGKLELLLLLLLKLLICCS
ncbi:testis-expressed protein 101 [Pteronotus mesoamericanus]|uniref:testis-expressed protein 101 n=1 Tax=Pteronotus mesoamericanus TaxID=1884717 RepID=UPI0023EB1049|nr:testis-expressed protein 101 [Pteronotus parnellii mesoamericanus]